MQQYNLLNESQFNTHCTNFSDWDWKSLNLVRSIAATVGAVIIVAILSFLLYYKAYSSLFQRLYLYLIIATLLNEIVGIISIEHQWRYQNQENVCIWVGLFLGWTYVLLFIFSYEIIVYLLYLVVSNIMGTQLDLTQCWTRHKIIIRCRSVTVEIIYITLPVLISTAFALPPLVQHRYGIAGPWCFVRSLNDSCFPSGYAIQMAFYGMYMALGVAGIVASLIFSVVYFKLVASFREARHLLKRTLYVLVFKFIHILMIMCSVACRLYTLRSRRHQLYGLWLTHALSVPIGVLVFPLGYFFCFHPVGNIANKIYKKIAHRCCRHRPSPIHVETQSITRKATAPRSDRISQPSYTYFDVPHPEVKSETSPLISDTGYGSTHFTS